MTGQDTAPGATRAEDEGRGSQEDHPKQIMVAPDGNETTAGVVVANTGVAALQHGTHHSGPTEGTIRAVPVRWVSSPRMMGVAEMEVGLVRRVGQRTTVADHSACLTNHQRRSWRVQHLWTAALQTLLGRIVWTARCNELWQTCTLMMWSRCWMRALILIDAATPQLW
jgi:hypothetical protein